MKAEKKYQKVFSLKEIFWKNTNNLTRKKKLLSKWILNIFVDILCILHNFRIPAELNPLTIIFFSFITWLYQSTIHLAGMGFKSDNLDDILTSVGSFAFIRSCVNSWSANQSLYLLWMNDFAALFTDKSSVWNLLVRLWGTITTWQLFSTLSFFNVSLSCPLKVSIIIKAYCSKSIFQVRRNYFFKKFNRFLCVWPMIFCERYRKKNTWADFVQFSLHKLAGLV